MNIVNKDLEYYRNQLAHLGQDPEVKFGHFINGSWMIPQDGQFINSINPSNGLPLANFLIGTSEHIDFAVRNAEQGYKEWINLAPKRRSQILFEIARLIRLESDKLSEMETLQTGKPIQVSKGDVETCARYFEYFAGIADKIFSEVIPASNEHFLYTLREPYGVTAHIIPWNGPITQAGRGIAPALAAGNSAVVKPDEQTSASTLKLAQICIDAGLPPGVLNVVTGNGFETGQSLVAHHLVRKICFTGSVATGKLVLKLASERVCPVTAELGGKSPFIVFEDASLAEAAKLAVKAFVFNSGQICSAGTRLLVQSSITEEFTSLLVRELEKVSIGPGHLGCDIGPVISNKQMERILNYIEIAKSEGAQLAFGGNRLINDQLNNGFFVAPTLFKDVSNSMTIAQEEVFGPVGCIISFDSENEAIEIANDSEYGLAAAIFTNEIGRAHRISSKLEAGQIYVNDFMPIGVEAPFGGYKLSGIGREKGIESIWHYTQLKSVAIRVNQ